MLKKLIIQRNRLETIQRQALYLISGSADYELQCVLLYMTLNPSVLDLMIWLSLSFAVSVILTIV
jgi:hypothetical protein